MRLCPVFADPVIYNCQYRLYRQVKSGLWLCFLHLLYTYKERKFDYGQIPTAVWHHFTFYDIL